MAVAAELLKQQSNEFDWNNLEVQLLDHPAADERAPESEIYGRSLSSIRRLGAFMILHSLKEAVDSPEAAQAKVEFYTSVEEGFGTDMELGGGLEVRDFDARPVVNGLVMSKDAKTAVSTMTGKGLKCAVKKADRETTQGDIRFVPQLVRTHWDHENALTVDAMVRRETAYNTRIVVSPFPEEAAAESGDAYWGNIGYVPHLRRGFVQLYHVMEDGTLLSGSLSFDGSNKQQLRELFAELGVEIPEGEVTDNWLKYAITATLSETSAKELATSIADRAGDSSYAKDTNTVDVTEQYRPIMERAFNESYVHMCESLARGYQTDGARDIIFRLADKAADFNERYATALYEMRANPDQFSDDDSVVLHELLVYSTIEMMRALHLAGGADTEQMYYASAYLQGVDGALFQDILSGFGADGARNNRSYSACGLSISAGDDRGRNSPQSAFGGQDTDRPEDRDKKGSRWFTCPKGHMNYRRKANILESNCRQCGAEVACKPVSTQPKHVFTQRSLFGLVKRAENRRQPKNPEKQLGSKVLAASLA